MYISKEKRNQQLFFHNQNCHLLFGDCVQVMKNIRSETIDVIFADPPYFLSRQTGKTYQNGKITSVYKGKWDEPKTIAEKLQFNYEWLKECKRILKKTGTIWITGSKHNIYSVGVALEQLEFQIINNIAWIKNNATTSITHRVLNFDNETILWAKKSEYGGYTYNYDTLKQLNNNQEMTDVWTIPVVNKTEKQFGNHPTQKPLKLLERIILCSTKKEMIILDPFAGSSTTGVAALKHNCKYIGIETDRNYLELSKRRILDL